MPKIPRPSSPIWIPVMILVCSIIGLGVSYWIRSTVNPMMMTRIDTANAVSRSIYLKDFPIYPQAVQEDGAPYNKTSVAVAVWHTPADVETVTSWYMDMLPRYLWRLDGISERQAGLDMRMLTFRRVEQIVNISIAADAASGSTKITVEFPASAYDE